MMTQLDLLQFIHEKEIAEMYPNLWISHRASLTLTVKWLLSRGAFQTKSYLRSSVG